MDWRHVGELLDAGQQTYGEMLNLAVWVKSNAGQGSFYRSNTIGQLTVATPGASTLALSTVARSCTDGKSALS